jgi:hypothetical protein
MAWQNDLAVATAQRSAPDEEQRRLVTALGLTATLPLPHMWQRLLDTLGVGSASQTLIERKLRYVAGTGIPAKYAWLRLGTAALSYTNTLSASGTEGVSYSSGSSATGGKSPYTYAVISGSLPTGLTLNASTGVVSGTPSAAEAYPYTIRVTDSAGLTKTISGTITVAAA